MDSGNSGSMQSSSGGDEEYDSRAETISPFFNPSVSFGSISNHPQPPPQPPPLFHHHQSHHPPTLFDPQAHNLGPFSHSPVNPNANHLYNLDLVWSRGLRSEPNYTDLGNVTGLSSSSSTLPSSSQSLIGVQGHSQGPFPSSSSSSMPLLPSVDGNGGIGGASATTPPRSSDQTITNQVKSSRKRTRASRRAPTTVLTTDTSNFRQMVQEFTGIPAPPFSASSSPYSRRLDLFGAGSALRSGHLDSLGPLYPFRPSAQKVQLQPSPFVSSSSSPSFLNSTMNIEAITTTNNSTTTNNNITTTTSIAGASNTFSSTSSSYQQQQQQQQHPSDLGLLSKQPQSQTMLNMQNPILTFQSLLQSPVFGSKSEGRSAIPSLDELGMTHEHVNANLSGFPSHGSSDGIRVGSNNHLSRWRSGEEASTERDHHQEHLGSFDGDHGEDSQNVSSYKLNCLASTSDFHHEN